MPIRPGGAADYDHEADMRKLPYTDQPVDAGGLRWKDLPAVEQLRRRVEDSLRFYATRHGRLLTAELMCRRHHWPESRIPEVTAAMHDPVTVANLRELGLIAPGAETWDQAVAGAVQPTKTQMDALDAIFTRLDPDDPRPLKDLLKEQGVDLRTWNGWLADPMFGAYVRDRSAQVFGQRAHEVDIALMRRAFGGDVAAMKLILELQGRIKTHGDTVDVNMLLSRVVEIIQLEVSDQAAVLRIAERLEALSQQAGQGKLPTSSSALMAYAEPLVLEG